VSVDLVEAGVEAGGESGAALSIGASAGELRRASEWLELTGTTLTIPPAAILRLDVCLNEALANVMAHGGAAAVAAPVQLLLRVDTAAAGGTASLTISDAGTAFDPVAAPAVARPASLMDAEPGGLGLLMMRQSADQLSYRYHAGLNELTCTVRWTING
jgi:anti-sigma regulatory factor (Ser/Thr protein kinase)